MNNFNYEILAPAGSVEQLTAAVNNGCNAVYLGLDSFNARMKAPNFTAQNLRQWVDYCHFFDVKVYVTVNTSIKNCEVERAAEAVRTAYDCFADGVIVTDLALLRYAASLPKPFSVVASTQLNVHDRLGAEFVRNLGADTVVCSRECSYEQIKEIAATGVKVECFLHGALCVCQSGQCFFSSIVGGNSGNRGLCAQPCRKFYKSNVGNYTKGGYLLSASDICGLDTAQKLLECGATTFKIEGRNRRAEYAGATSKVYSELFANNFRHTKNDFNLLAEMYNRGNLPSCNYLEGANHNVIFPDAQNHIGVQVGTVKGGCVNSCVPLRKGDGLKVFDGNLEYCGGIALEDGVGCVRAQFSLAAQDGMIVRRTTSQKLCEEISVARRRRPLEMKLSAFVNDKCLLTLISGNVSVTVRSENVLPSAISKPTTKEDFVTQLEKIGDSPFELKNVEVRCNGVFMAKSQINALRRNGLELLYSAVVNEYNRQFGSRSSMNLQFKCRTAPSVGDKTCLAVVCYTSEQVNAVRGVADYVLLKVEKIDETSTANLPENCFVDLPPFCDCNYLLKLLKTNRFGIVCNNVGHVQLAREAGVPYVAGAGLNLFNDEMVGEFSDATTFLYSQELTLNEISRFGNKNGLTFVDGKISLMKLVHCPYKVVFDGGCDSCKVKNRLIYTDELGNDFEISRRRDVKCNFELYNGKKLSVADKLQVAGRYCVDYDNAVLSHYLNVNKGIVDDFVEEKEFTRGRLYKKIH